MLFELLQLCSFKSTKFNIKCDLSLPRVKVEFDFVASQLSNDRDPDPDVGESCGAFKPARGTAMFPARCRVSG